MRMTYLGLFSSVFNWVFERILSPVVKFLAEILSSIFEWIFNTILQPLLVLVFKTVLPWAIDLFRDIFCGLMYGIMAWICKILDYFQEIFQILAGTQPVRVMESASEYKESSLLGAVFSLPEVHRMFMYMLVLGFGLAFTCAIIGVVKSSIDLDFEGKRPVGTVLKNLFKAFINFLTLNLGVVFVLMLAARLLGAVNVAAGTNETSLGRVVFCSTTLNAHKNDTQNIDNFPVDKNIMTDTDRKLFYYTDAGKGGKDYTNTDEIKKYFELKKLDFGTGIVICVFLAIVFFGVGITLIQRIFEIIILYLVSPLFVATMPLDDGEKYKKWKDLFIGKTFTGFGTILAMNLFLLLVPMIMGNHINWGQETAEGTYIFKLLFLCGGAYALTKVGPMITTLINWQAGQAESSNMAYSSGLIGGASVGMAFKAARGMTSFVGGTLAKPFRGAYNYAFGNGDRGMIADKKWKSMQNNGLSDEDRKKKEEEDQKKKGPADDNKALDKKKDNDNLKAPDNVGKLSGFDSFMKGVHKFLPSKEDKNGNYSVGLLGVSINYDKNGNKTGFSLPCLSWKKNDKGEMQFDSYRIPGVCKVQRGETSGKLKLSSIPAIGFSRYEDATGQNRISSVLGFHQDQGNDGSMHVTKGWFGYRASASSDDTYHIDGVMGIKFGRAYNQETGHYETSGVRVGNFIFGGPDATPGSANIDDEKKAQAEKAKQNQQ